MRIQIDLNTFNGEIFAQKYNLTTEDFWVEGSELICPSLESADISDCVVDAVTPAIAAEWKKANDLALGVLDLNSRGQCQYLAIKHPDNISLQNDINNLWNAMESIWNVYAQNKLKIENGQEPDIEYTIPSDLPTIWDVMSRVNGE